MTGLGSGDLRSIDPRRLEPLIGLERVELLVETASSLRTLLGDRRIVNVNSTATGGGVAEMLGTLLGYVRGIGLDATWLVISGDPEFFAVTKRIHNGLYGAPGDGGEFDDRARAIYERTIGANVDQICADVRESDIVIVHDPQPAGLIAPLVDMGAKVVWRCHVGYDGRNRWTERAWAFVRPYVEAAHAYVFSRESFAPSWIDRSWLWAIPPSIDPFTAKNQPLERDEVLGLLGAAGLVSRDGVRPDARVRHPALVVRTGEAPDPQTPLVVQVSRWDRMKDMTGVLHAFTRHVDADDAQLVLAGPAVSGEDMTGVLHAFTRHVDADDAQLVLAGPAVSGVGDDPEGEAVWQETLAAWEELAPSEQARVQLVSVPMDDPSENALVVNALQRHAAVVVQKSLAEGFGLTVAEAMWKGRPVVARAVGGIVDQVLDGVTGLLVADPYDLVSCGAAVARLLRDTDLAARLARGGRRHVERHFLGDRHLIQYAELLTELVST